MFGLTPYNRRNEGLIAKGNVWDLRGIFDDFFNDSFLPEFLGNGNPLKADIREMEKEYIIDAEIPGVNKEDIKLDLRDDTLTVSVEHNQEIKEEKENYLRRERRYGSYSRCFYVENVKHDEVSAKYENGVLTVKLPKDETGKKKGHRIDVQ